MERNTPKYTIDTCSLASFFRENGFYNKDNFRTLWLKIEKMLFDKIIISHIEVLNEIKEGDKNDSLLVWAKDNDDIFNDYDLSNEPQIIKQIGNISTKFISQGKEKLNADPWLIAQAKVNNLTVITQETKGETTIPTICKKMGVQCLDVIGLIKQENIII